VIIGGATIFVCLLLRVCKMTSPQGMDELFWGRDHEDVNDGQNDSPWLLRCKT
jgi:hypothetical protein